MKIHKLLGGGPTPADSALAELRRLEGQERKLEGRLATAVALVEKANAERRQALVEREPDVAEMARLNEACSRQAEARSGIEEAMRHVVAQLADARATHAAHVDSAKRETVIQECEARAAAIDAAAERLAAAAKIFSDARIEMQAAIAAHGVAVADVHPEHLAYSIVVDAVRIAAPGILRHTPYLAPPLSVLTSARQSQSGRLRDHADEMKAGVLPVEAPARPREAGTRGVILIQERSVVLKHGIAYTGPGGLPVLINSGASLIPAPVAEAAIKAGMAVPSDTPEAAEILRKLQAVATRPPLGLKSPTEAHAAHVPLDFDMGLWIEAERARMGEAAA